MKTRDLAIYDWVVYKERICTVLGIDALSDTLSLEVNNDYMERRFNVIPIADVEPVPLTEEILVSNGARKEGSLTFFIGDVMLDRYVTFWNVFFSGHTYSIKQIKYVHELQHCLSFLDDKRQFQTF